ncbi:uncharacterized protein LOC144624765 [Crassostrea virginica]
MYGVDHKSAEHAFQYAKAVRCGYLNAATSINEAKNALAAKRIGDKIQSNKQWNDTCENGTENTKISSWPGKDLLGQIIQKVAKKSERGKRVISGAIKAKQKSKSKQDVKQLDISKMLRNLRSQSDSDSFSGIDASSDSNEETSAASGKGKLSLRRYV